MRTSILARLVLLLLLVSCAGSVQAQHRKKNYWKSRWLLSTHVAYDQPLIPFQHTRLTDPLLSANVPMVSAHLGLSARVSERWHVLFDLGWGQSNSWEAAMQERLLNGRTHLQVREFLNYAHHSGAMRVIQVKTGVSMHFLKKKQRLFVRGMVGIQSQPYRWLAYDLVNAQGQTEERWQIGPKRPSSISIDFAPLITRYNWQLTGSAGLRYVRLLGRHFGVFAQTDLSCTTRNTRFEVQRVLFQDGKTSSFSPGYRRGILSVHPGVGFCFLL